MVRQVSALLLCALVTGCGFRSSLDTGEFELVSFTLDQPSYVQGEEGFATSTFVNVGPRPSAPPSVIVRGSGITEGLVFIPQPVPEIVEPGATVYVKWSFTSGETMDPGTGAMWVKITDAGGVTESAPVPFELLRAATLQVLELVYISAVDYGSGDSGDVVSFVCRGVRGTFVEATVKNVGASRWYVSGEQLVVTNPAGTADPAFVAELHAENPDFLESNAIGTFRFRLTSDGEALPESGYAIAFDAEVADATTGHERPPPTPPAIALPLTVHRGAAFAITVAETAGDVSAVAPNVGPFSVTIQNTGTVSADVTEVLVRMFAPGETTTEYSVGTPSVALPVALGPGVEVTVIHAVTLTSQNPTLGVTVSQGVVSGIDDACSTSLSGNSEESASEGAWTVIP